MPRVRLLAPLALTAIALLATACNGSAAGSQGDASGSPSTSAAPATASPSPTPTVDPASVKANELGLVPVLMYHQIVAHPRDVYDQTPAHFRAELEKLATQGYVPITAADFATGHIDIPAGKHPVVLTFDDSTLSQFALGTDGAPKPGTAVAILLEVARAHPGFTPTATFYVNNSPFVDRDGTKTLGWLHQHGFDIGDHTVSHANLRQLPVAKAEQEIAANLAMITKAAPGVEVRTIALPYGAYPQDVKLAHTGSAGGTSYDFAGVYLVGSNPSHSPFHKAFDPFNIPRIRSGEPALQAAADRPFVSDYYLDWLQKHAASRYTSDGNPAKVSFPKAFADVLGPKYQAEAQPY
jgi:peptidoglycan/xylan/chitin deacetylase (PgdA/CDA1 family)